MQNHLLPTAVVRSIHLSCQLLATLLFLSTVLSSAYAKQIQQSFQVTATIVPGCLVSSVNSYGQLNFGSYLSLVNSTISTAFVQNAGMSIACTQGVILSMAINGGSYYANSRRNLKHSSIEETIPYQLYYDNSFSSASLIPINQSVTINYTNSNNIILPIYGVVQLTGNSSPGSYTDTLTVTLTW